MVIGQAQAKLNKNGEITGYVGTITDITERKKIETSLQTLNNQLSFLLSPSPAVIYTCKSTIPYETTFVSNNITQLLGYTAEEFLADANFWIDHVHPEDRNHSLLQTGQIKVLIASKPKNIVLSIKTAAGAGCGMSCILFRIASEKLVNSLVILPT